MVKICQSDFNQTGIAVVQDFNSKKLHAIPLYDNDIVFEARKLIENPVSTFRECLALYGCICNSKFMYNLKEILFYIRKNKREYGILPENIMKDLRAGIMGLEKDLNTVHNYLYC